MDYEMKTPLAVQGLCKNYPAFQLRDVSFSLVPGTITAAPMTGWLPESTTVPRMGAFWARAELIPKRLAAKIMTIVAAFANSCLVIELIIFGYNRVANPV